MYPVALRTCAPAPPMGPIVVYAHNILDTRKKTVFRAEAGRSLRELQPNVNLPRLCFYNGELAVPEDWDWIPSADDHVAFVTLPKGGGNVSMSIIGIILIVVGFVVPGAQALIFVGAGLLVSGLIPTPNVAAITDNAQGSSPSPTYNIQAGGNSARIGQAIPVIYGRHIIMPDFASQSYSEYLDNGDQLYFCLLCLGQMDKFTLEATLIDDTDISHFVDVETQLTGPDFALPLSLMNPAVVNAPEVANNTMVYGTYIGPFAACGPGIRALFIGIDMVCPKGLWHALDDGTMTNKSATWLAEARPITDTGGVAGDWFLLGFETLTSNSNTEIRRTYKYAVAAGRYEIRLSRQEVEDTSSRTGHQLIWQAMRAYLDIIPPLEPSATFMAVKMRANSQLSASTQRRFSAIIRRWLPTWDPIAGWSDPVYTQSIAWALADVCRNVDYGAGMPDTRVDLQTLFELDAIWTARGDTFNGVFDKRITVWAALTTIARCGRARPIIRGGVVTFVRDTEQELPVALFSMRNIKRNTFSIDFTMVTEDDADGIELEYFSSETWASAFVRVPLPGIDESTKPAPISLLGIDNLEQATREANYMVADSAFRRCAIAFTTEMEGYLPAYGDLIAVSHDLAGWGASGDVEYWDHTTKTMRVSEDISWTVGDHYAILVGDQGDVFGPYKVSPGPAPRTMMFDEFPDEDVEIYTGTEREVTRFSMGPASSYAKLCRVVSITPSDGDTVQIKAVVEDNRVHAADGGGSTTPPGSGRHGVYAPDGLAGYLAATDAERAHYAYFTGVDGNMSNGDEGYTYT